MVNNARIAITAEDRTRRAVQSAQRNFKGLQSVVAGIGAAVGVSMAGLAAYGAAQARLITENKKLADQMGITTQSLTELSYAFSRDGLVTAEQFADALQELNLRLGEAAVTGGGALVDAFKELGISVQEVRSLKTDEMVLRIADAFGKLEDKQRGMFLLDEIFSGEGARFVKTMEQGSAKIKEFAERYRELSGNISDEDAEKIKNITQKWFDLNVALDGLVNTIIVIGADAGVTDWIEDVTKALTDFSKWVKSNEDVFKFLIGMTPFTGFKSYRDAVNGLTDSIYDNATAFQIWMIDQKLAAGQSEAVTESLIRQRDAILAIASARNQSDSGLVIDVTKGNDKPSAAPEKGLFTNEQMLAIDRANFQAANDAFVEFVLNPMRAEEEENKRRAEEWASVWTDAAQTFSSGVGDAFASAIMDQESLGDALQMTMRAVAKQVISSLIQIGVQRAIQATIGKGELVASTAAGVASASTLAAAYAPAALAVNIATMGGAAIAAASTAPIAASAQLAAMASTKLSGIAHDGLDFVPKTGTYLLEKGERVIKKEDNKKGMMGGNTYNFTIQAIDTQSGVDFLMQNESAIAAMMQSRYESSGRTGGPIR